LRLALDALTAERRRQELAIAMRLGHRDHPRRAVPA
jgi:hypothetical protein